jgi:hypothetical protein
MKLFFSTTPRAKEDYNEEINTMYRFLHKSGYNLTEKYIETANVQEFYSWTEEDKEKYYEDTIKAIRSSDVTLFEVSKPSLGVGHLIGKALSFEKPVVVAYTKGHNPFMLESARENNIILIEYSLENLEKTITDAIDYAKEKKLVRFNFFISPEIESYLNWKAKTKNIPRSVFLRSLIEDSMLTDEEYTSRK